MGFSCKLADRNTWTVGIPKTIGGDKLILVALQSSKRKKKTEYMYKREGKAEIYYNNAKDAPWFIPIADKILDMAKFYQLFTDPNLTDEQAAFLKRNDYNLVD